MQENVSEFEWAWEISIDIDIACLLSIHGAIKDKNKTSVFCMSLDTDSAVHQQTLLFLTSIGLCRVQNLFVFFIHY